MKNSNNKNRSGFTLIEGLTLLFVFSLITVTFYNVITVGTRFILTSKNRLGAIALANEKMEIIRNLDYNNVGIVGGIVSGNIPQDEDVSENGKNYHVRTLVQYEDDLFDGTLGGSPNDTAYKDYKTAKVIISWNNGSSDQGKVEVISRFVPPGLEVESVGDGILSINVFSSQSGNEAVTGALVNITNTDFPSLNLNVSTDDGGNVMLVGAEESIQRYRLIVSKSGYETIETFPPYPDSSYNPANTHASVVAGFLNLANIDMNKLADIEISSIDNLNDPVDEVEFSLSGGRILGTEVASPSNIYSTNIADETGPGGSFSINDTSPGNYVFSLADSDYELISVNPDSSFYLAPETTINLEAKVASKNVAGLLAKAISNLDTSPIEGAEVKLSNPSIPFEVIVTTGSNGKAYFPSGEDPLVAGSYILEIKASGFQDSSQPIEISSGSLSVNEILMTPN